MANGWMIPVILHSVKGGVGVKEDPSRTWWHYEYRLHFASIAAGGMTVNPVSSILRYFAPILLRKRVEIDVIMGGLLGFFVFRIRSVSSWLTCRRDKLRQSDDRMNI